MAKTYPTLTGKLQDWIVQQPMYFLASAPLQADGHVNLSPRGLDTLRIVADTRVLLLDLTGSGNETAAHVHENGRLTLMLCAFSGNPKILRLYGQARVILPTDPEWAQYRGLFTADLPGVRQMFVLDITRIQTSCGFGVPLMQLVSQRHELLDWARNKGPEGIKTYQRNKNACSLDGLPTPGITSLGKDASDETPIK